MSVYLLDYQEGALCAKKVYANIILLVYVSSYMRFKDIGGNVQTTFPHYEQCFCKLLYISRLLLSVIVDNLLIKLLKTFLW